MLPSPRSPGSDIEVCYRRCVTVARIVEVAVGCLSMAVLVAASVLGWPIDEFVRTVLALAVGVVVPLPSSRIDGGR